MLSSIRIASALDDATSFLENYWKMTSPVATGIASSKKVQDAKDVSTYVVECSRRESVN
jgi:hypothetical protein